MYKWAFPSNNGGEVKGLSDSGTETFRGTPLKSLAREICQNSLDAAANGKKVTVEFSPFFLDKNTFPDRNNFEKFLLAGLGFIKEPKKTAEFYEKALKILNYDNIPFLRISDFNTTGLKGSREEYNTPWFNLTKASGLSDKSGTAGGSFGIGKYAPFACSNFRTVFYHTLDEEGYIAAQGVSRISSFKDPYSGEITAGTGYYGKAGNLPTFDSINLDRNYKRTTPGTDVFIAAFKYLENDWKDDIVGSILDGFLYAIFTEKLVVIVDDVVMDKENLERIITDYGSNISEYAHNYYQVLIDSESKWFELDYRNHGLIKLGLLIKPELHRKVAMIRKTGMKILDRGHISALIPFAGVLLIQGNMVNDYLRNLENPQHTNWQPERIEPRTRLPEAKAYIKGLNDFIKDSLAELAKDDSSEQIDPDLGQFLPDESDVSDERETAKIESLPASIKTIEISVPKKPQSNNNFISGNDKADIFDPDGLDEESTEAGGSGGNDGSSGGGNGTGQDEGDGKGDNPIPKNFSRKQLDITRTRTICINKEEGDYAIFFTPSESATDGELRLYLAAESDNYEAPLVQVYGKNAASLFINKNTIRGLTFEKDQQIRLRVKLDFYDYCSMEIRAYGNKK